MAETMSRPFTVDLAQCQTVVVPDADIKPVFGKAANKPAETCKQKRSALASAPIVGLIGNLSGRYSHRHGCIAGFWRIGLIG